MYVAYIYIYVCMYVCIVFSFFHSVYFRKHLSNLCVYFGEHASVLLYFIYWGIVGIQLENMILSGCLVGLPHFALPWSIEPVSYCTEVIAIFHYLNGSAQPLNLIADRLCGEFIFYIYCWAFWQMKGRWVLSAPGCSLEICSDLRCAFHCGLCLRKPLPSVRRLVMSLN